MSKFKVIYRKLNSSKENIFWKDEKFAFFQIKLSEIQKWPSNLRVKSDDKGQVYNIFILKGRTVGTERKNAHKDKGTSVTIQSSKHSQNLWQKKGNTEQ